MFLLVTIDTRSPGSEPGLFFASNTMVQDQPTPNKAGTPANSRGKSRGISGDFRGPCVPYVLF